MTLSGAPRVSYVVPAYNYAHFVGAAVDSLLEQNFESLEVIVIDDCSTDDTQNVLERYRSEPRVRLVHHAQNRGHIATYNEGLANARGEFVGLLSADDICLRRDAVERMVTIFDSEPQVGFVYSALCHVDTSGAVVDVVERWPFDCAHDGLVEFRALALTNFIPASGTLVRASCHKVVGFYDERLRHAGDWDLWLRLAARYRVGYVSDSLFGWRLHSLNMHDSRIQPDQADSEHALTLRRAFESLPASAPASIRRLERPAFRHVAVRTIDLQRRAGRHRAAWKQALAVLVRDPSALAERAFWAASLRLAVVSVVGPQTGRALRAWRSRSRPHHRAMGSRPG